MINCQVLLDTNLLVLLVVGMASPDYILKHKRLTEFTVKDYDALVRILSRATGVLVTPNTLTETSNLAAYIAEPARTKVFNALRNLIDLSEETYIPSRPASKRHEFLRLGLTDAALITSSSQETVVLTTDLDLYLATVSTGAPAFNFNHIREEYLFD